MPTPLQRQLPNALTMLRLVMAGAFFTVLSVPGLQSVQGEIDPFRLHLATALFILGAITDALDGHLARRWRVESAFGRIMDPVCDKVLVLGAFVYLAGSPLAPASGVATWMVVLIIFRELLVTGIRSVLEATGHTFAANWWGKAKMILQTIAIPAVLIILAVFPPDHPDNIAFRVVRDVVVWATLIATVFSGVPYVIDAVRVMRPAPSNSKDRA